MIVFFMELISSGRHESGGSCGFISPLGRKLLGLSVVSGESVDSGLDQSQVVLGVLVLSAFLKMLSDTDSLPDQTMDIFGDLGSAAILLEDSCNLLASEELGAGDSLLSLITTPI